jgi:hypothetical protein
LSRPPMPNLRSWVDVAPRVRHASGQRRLSSLVLGAHHTQSSSLHLHSYPGRALVETEEPIHTAHIACHRLRPEYTTYAPTTDIPSLVPRSQAREMVWGTCD